MKLNHFWFVPGLMKDMDLSFSVLCLCLFNGVFGVETELYGDSIDNPELNHTTNNTNVEYAESRLPYILGFVAFLLFIIFGICFCCYYGRQRGAFLIAWCWTQEIETYSTQYFTLICLWRVFVGHAIHETFLIFWLIHMTIFVQTGEITDPSEQQDLTSDVDWLCVLHFLAKICIWVSNILIFFQSFGNEVHCLVG